MALSAQRSNQPAKWTRKRFTLAANHAAYKGGAACLSLAGGSAPGKVIPGATATTLLYIGTFAENKATSASDQLVDVDLGEEIEVRWYTNGSSSIAATDIGGLCYIVDDTTVAKSATGKSLAGRIWDVDSTKGVAVQKLPGTQTTTSTGAIDSSEVTPSATAYEVLRTNAGATASEWGRLIETYAAIDATNDVTIQVTQGKARKITLSGNSKNVTLGTTGAVAGDIIFIWRAAIGATSGSNIINGGGGAGTLMAMTANKKAGCVVMFDGTNWGLVANYQEA